MLCLLAVSSGRVCTICQDTHFQYVAFSSYRWRLRKNLDRHSQRILPLYFSIVKTNLDSSSNPLRIQIQPRYKSITRVNVPSCPPSMFFTQFLSLFDTFIAYHSYGNVIFAFSNLVLIT